MPPKVLIIRLFRHPGISVCETIVTAEYPLWEHINSSVRRVKLPVWMSLG